MYVPKGKQNLKNDPNFLNLIAEILRKYFLFYRHTEAVSMRSQALKAVEISERGNLPGSGERRSSGSTATGPTSPLVIDSTYYKGNVNAWNIAAKTTKFSFDIKGLIKE